MIKISLLMLLLLVFQSAFGSAVKISYTSANDLILTAQSCDQLVVQHKAICAWKKVNRPDFKLPIIDRRQCRKNSKNQFSITVSECLPAFVKQNQHKKLYHSGANCWGTAMSFKKISTRPRFIWSKEMTYWMNSPICRKLSPGEQKKSGDFLNMYGPEFVFHADEANNKGNLFWQALFPRRLTAPPRDYGYSGFHHFLHTETFLTDEITFGKDSPEDLARFEFHEMSEVYAHPRESECQENQRMIPHLREYQHEARNIRGTHCDYFSLAYRCSNFEDYFTKQELSPVDQQLWQQIQILQAKQEILFPLLTVSTTHFSPEEVKHFLSLADAMSEQALNELNYQTFDKTHEMLLVLKYFSAHGIRKSLEHARLTPATEEL